MSKELKKLESGRLAFFSEADVPVVKCSNLFKDWLLVGLPFNCRIVARGRIQGQKGHFLRKV